jgi:heme O synthase-like polyprenyltransferase
VSGPGPRRPTLRERARPAEVLGLAAVLAGFVGVAVLFSARNLLLAIEFFGAAFVVSIVVCATLLLAISKPDPPEPPDGGSTGH